MTLKTSRKVCVSNFFKPFKLTLDTHKEIDVSDADESKDQVDDNSNDGGDEDSDEDGNDNDADYETYEDDEEEEKLGIMLKGHTESVLSVAVSSKGEFLVTGGQDDKAIMWSVDVAKVRTVYDGHKDSVCSVCISCKETYVATGDMSGLIQVWKRDLSLDVKDTKIFDYEVDDLQWMSWHPLSDTVLVAGDQSGTVWIFKVTDGTIKSLQGLGVPCTTGKITKCGTRLLAGYDDGTLRLWDLKTSLPIHSFIGSQAHSSSVTSIDIDDSDSLAASGSTDCNLKLINLQSGKIVVTIPCGKNPVEADKSRFEAEKEAVEQEETDTEVEDSLETVTFCTRLPLIATATLKGIIEIWDVPSHAKRTTFFLEERLSKICWNPCSPFVLFASGLDGSIGSWDVRSGKAIFKKSIHEDQILDFNFSEDGNLLVTACDDGTCCIMNGSDFKAEQN